MNIGLVGCGRSAQLHMCAYKRISEANVVAVSDVDQVKVGNFSRKYGISDAFRDYSKMLEMSDIDYVDICTPTATHAKIACEAARHHHDILLEKPMARDSIECDRILREASRHQVKLCICHNQLFIPEIIRIKNLVDSEEFQLTHLRTSIKENPEMIGTAVRWITTQEQGGILWESGIHLAYLQQHFLKDVTEVLAVGSKIKYSVYDHLSVLLRTSGQAMGIIELAWPAARPECTYEFMGSDGKIMQIIDYRLLFTPSETPRNFVHGLYLDEKAALKRWVGPIINNLSKPNLLKCQPHHSLINRFIQSLREDSEPPVTPEDGRRAIRLLECIEESLNTNLPVRMKETAN